MIIRLFLILVLITDSLLLVLAEKSFICTLGISFQSYVSEGEINFFRDWVETNERISEENCKKNSFTVKFARELNCLIFL